MQRDRKIVIKPCDKGAGILILDLEDYLKACYNHLTSEVSPGKPYYSQVNVFDIEKTKTEIKDVLQEGLDKNIITKSELQAMNPDDKNVGRFYCNFKVHKPHEHNTVPPERPIISQSGSMCENIAQFVEFHINHIGMEHESFLQDTPDFLRTIKHLNKGNTLKSNTVLFTMDVKGLFTNIIHEEGLKALEEALNKRQNPKIETDFIL